MDHPLLNAIRPPSGYLPGTLRYFSGTPPVPPWAFPLSVRILPSVVGA